MNTDNTQQYICEECGKEHK